MTRRTRLAAVFAAAGLLSMAASAAIAAPPTYSITVTKTANPTAVPPTGGLVDFTIQVTATGTGFFQTVVVTDTMVGCTVAGPTGDAGSDGKLSPGETWTYTCTVDNVLPDDTNTANVNACHSIAVCGATHDATGSASVTLDTGAATEAPPTEAPPTEAPPTGAVPTPTSVVSDATDVPDATLSSTDTDGISAGPHGGDIKSMFMLLAVLFLLAASIIAMTPAAPKAKARGRS